MGGVTGVKYRGGGPENNKPPPPSPSGTWKYCTADDSSVRSLNTERSVLCPRQFFRML